MFPSLLCLDIFTDVSNCICNQIQLLRFLSVSITIYKYWCITIIHIQIYLLMYLLVSITKHIYWCISIFECIVCISRYLNEVSQITDAFHCLFKLWHLPIHFSVVIPSKVYTANVPPVCNHNQIYFNLDVFELSGTPPTA